MLPELSPRTERLASDAWTPHTPRASHLGDVRANQNTLSFLQVFVDCARG